MREEEKEGKIETETEMEIEMEEREIMTSKELAEYLGLSKNWIYKKAEAGEIPGVKLGHRWRFKKSVIDRWLEERIEEANHG